MKTEDFNALVERRIALIREVLQKKAGEYASDADRLHNFKKAGELHGTDAKDALWGMAMKHLVCVADFTLQDGPIPKEAVDEKLGDLINYLFLLEAVMEDERNA